jgi:hypothetical protein
VYREPIATCPMRTVVKGDSIMSTSGMSSCPTTERSGEATAAHAPRAVRLEPMHRSRIGAVVFASSLCKEEGPLGGSLGPSVSGLRKPFPGARDRTRPETRFACDRDRFACKNFERNWDTLVSSEL